MRTAFLGAYGFGNLGDELCLIEALAAFPAGDRFAFSCDPAWTRRCVPGLAGCFRDAADMLALAPRRVVFGGGMFGTPDAFAAWMPHLAAARAESAEIHLHNLGIAWLTGDLGWLDDAARAVFRDAASFTARDPLGVEYAAMAGLGRLPRISRFPETDIAADPALAEALLPRRRKLLGISIIPTPAMRACLAHDAARVRGVLAAFADHAILPIVSTRHMDSAAEDDAAGFRDFVAAFLPRAEIVAPILLDHGFWRAEMTPPRLKGLIARCDTLLTQRKHNAVHAIGAGVRVLGIGPLEDNSLRRTFIALADRLPAGSRCIGLDLPPAA